MFYLFAKCSEEETHWSQEMHWSFPTHLKSLPFLPFALALFRLLKADCRGLYFENREYCAKNFDCCYGA